MAFFAIQRISDGAYLPVGKHGQHTSVEPSKTEPPRLFVSKASATNALVAYSAGVHYLHRSGGGSMFGDDYEEYIDIRPNTSRPRLNFRVVKVGVRILHPRKRPIPH